jgi:hypothetical protein
MVVMLPTIATVKGDCMTTIRPARRAHAPARVTFAWCPFCDEQFEVPGLMATSEKVRCTECGEHSNLADCLPPSNAATDVIDDDLPDAVWEELWEKRS